MKGNRRVLLVSDSEALAAEARTALAYLEPNAIVQRLSDPAIASARLGGGDIDILLIDPAALGDHLPDWIRRSSSIPTILTAGPWSAELSRVAGMQARQRAAATVKWIGFLGAKGGVGTSTVSLNVACALADRENVLLVELSSGADSLALHLAANRADSPYQRFRRTLDKPSIWLALREDAASPDLEIAIQNSGADSIVLDLGSILTEPVRSVLPRLDSLVIVLDWEALSIECGRRTINAVSIDGATPAGRVRALLVNRSATSSPAPLEEVEKTIGVPVLAAIPPSADVCCAAAKSRRPLISFDPQGLASEGLVRAAASIVAGVAHQRGNIRGFQEMDA